MSNIPNELIGESSLYLLQHAYNPVAWKPWKKENLDEAIAQDKLIIISIGYAACHWCHVMEKESFENGEVAELMNTWFINIKIDREERPDIDHIYMNACHLINGSGGWPLHIIALPDGRPVYAGTYFPREKWMQLLRYFQQIWREDKNKMIAQATRITERLHLMEAIPILTEPYIFSFEELWNAHLHSQQNWDHLHGGRQGAPKFIMPGYFMYLIDLYHHTHEEKIKSYLLLSLDSIGTQGIYDQIGGGFARYATDESWLIPHFEKMLYDNAQIVSLYSRAARMFPDKKRYRRLVTQSMEFLHQKLSNKEGIYYSSLDADSEGIEGKYYLWSYDELKTLLKDDFDFFSHHYEIDVQGNWEGHIILARRENQLSDADDTRLAGCHKRLLDEREKRVAPALDDKAITAWNGLMISACCEAFMVTEDPAYLQEAGRTATFIANIMLEEDGKLHRNFYPKNNTATISGFLDDYAFTIKGFLDLYSLSFDEKWLVLATCMSEYALSAFYDPSSGMMHYKSHLDEKLIADKIEYQDNVIPSSCGVMAECFFLLGHHLERRELVDLAGRMAATIRKEIVSNSSWYYQWTSLLLKIIKPFFEVVVAGPEALALSHSIHRAYRPDMILAGSKNESLTPLLRNRYKDKETLIYVCINQTCLEPVKTVEDFRKIVSLSLSSSYV